MKRGKTKHIKSDEIRAIFNFDRKQRPKLRVHFFEKIASRQSGLNTGRNSITGEKPQGVVYAVKRCSLRTVVKLLYEGKESALEEKEEKINK